MLLRPVESYKKRYHFKLRQQEKAAKQNRTPIYKGPNHDVNSDPNPFLITSGDVYNTKGEGQDEDVSLVEDPCPDEANEDKYDGIGSKDDDPSFKEVLIHEDAENTQIKTSRQRSCSDAEQIKNGFTSGGLSPTLFSSQRNVLVPSRQISCDSSTVASSRKQISLERYTSQLSVVSHADLPCILPSLAEESEKSGRGCQLSTFIDLSLFKNWLFRMMMLFTALAVFSNYLTIYMPTIAVTSGIGKSDAAMLMTVSGVTDLVTRIVMGFIADFKFVSKPKLVAFSLAVITVICQCSRLFNTYKLFVAFAVLVGIFGGFRQNFYNVMLLDYFGAENIAKANGLAMMIATLVISLNHPVLGAMLDATGSFVIPLHYVGVMVMLSTIVILMEPLFKKLNDKKFMKENNSLTKEGGLKGDKEETEPLQKTELEV
ncbi:monocarboxylate transporter 2-like [Physella acuta]|uniref:monocarboxylate transporter 2-like n=1 Tax=Physella acuta TaxID=109671 RepID=UPI0027DC4603|nr:monocarboxylate transporter 2-like [Physella acuta]